LSRVRAVVDARAEERNKLVEGLMTLNDSDLVRLAMEALDARGQSGGVRLYDGCWLDPQLGIVVRSRRGDLCAVRYGLIPSSEAWRYQPAVSEADSSSSSDNGWNNARRVERSMPEQMHRADARGEPPPYVPKELTADEQRHTLARHIDIRPVFHLCHHGAEALMAVCIDALETVASDQ
jgi:hypothetical protein